MSQKPQQTPSDLILCEFEMFTPKTGYKLVGIDEFGIPCEKPYLMTHFGTYERALKALKEYERVAAVLTYCHLQSVR